MTVAIAEQLRLMRLADDAILDAVCGRDENDKRVVRELLDDEIRYARWRSEFRRLLLPVLDAPELSRKLAQLRRIASRFEHERALVEHLRRSSVTGDLRTRLFAALYTGIDYENAVVSAHHRYQFAVAGTIAVTGLLRAYDDSAALDLLHRYRALFARYFALYCQWLLSRDRVYAEILRSTMLDASREADACRAALLAAPRRLAHPRSTSGGAPARAGSLVARFRENVFIRRH